MRSAVWLIPVMTLLLLDQTANAYRCSQVPPDGPSVFWSERNHDFVINERGYDRADIFAAVRNSFITWNNVDCTDLVFEDGGTSSAVLVGFDWRDSATNENLVIWRHGDDGDPVDQWRHEAGSLAVTTTTFSARTGELFDADIEFNASGFPFSADATPDPNCTHDYDVQNTATHEIGHMLGLDHPPVMQNGAELTTMFYRANACEVSKRDLNSDDIEGLCAIYPRGQPYHQCKAPPAANGPDPIFTEVNGCSCTGTGSNNAVFALSIVPLLVLWRRR